MDRPTEFRGCMWDDGWEFDAPCVVYYPARYAKAGFGSNNAAIDNLVEDICCDIMDGRPHNDGGLDRECEWRGWGRHGFARRKRAEHVVIRVEWGEAAGGDDVTGEPVDVGSLQADLREARGRLGAMTATAERYRAALERIAGMASAVPPAAIAREALGGES